MLVEKLEVVFFVIGMVLGFLIAPQFVIKLVAAEFTTLSIFGVLYVLILWGTIVGVCGLATGCVGLKLKNLIVTWNDPGV